MILASGSVALLDDLTAEQIVETAKIIKVGWGEQGLATGLLVRK